jgi:hypothetical protein
VLVKLYESSPTHRIHLSPDTYKVYLMFAYDLGLTADTVAGLQRQLMH